MLKRVKKISKLYMTNIYMTIYDHMSLRSLRCLLVLFKEIWYL